MTEGEPRRIFVGLLPSAGSVVYAPGGEDPVAVLVREAGAELDRQRAEEARALAAKAAEIPQPTWRDTPVHGFGGARFTRAL